MSRLELWRPTAAGLTRRGRTTYSAHRSGGRVGVTLLTPSFVGVSEANGGASSSVGYNIPMPSGAAVDDVALLVVTQERDLLPTVPSGWTTLRYESNSTVMSVTIAWKRLVSSDLGTNVRPTWSSARRSASAVIVYRGVSDPVITTGAYATLAAGGNNLVTPTVTPAQDGSMLVACMQSIVYTSPYVRTATTASPWTERADGTSQSTTSTNGHTFIADQLLTGGAGAAQTGATVTMSSTQYNAMPSTVVFPPGVGADAGPDQNNIEPGSTVTLTATGSGNWAQTAGTAVTLAGTGNTVTFTAPTSLNSSTLTFAFGGDAVDTNVLYAAERFVSASGQVPFLLLPVGPAGDGFALGTTKPTLADPWNPTAVDNVGAAFGWNGVTLTTIVGDTTIPANTTVTNKRYQGYVTFTDSTSKAVNCVFEGRAPGGSFSSGLVKGANGGQLERCTIIGTATSAIYYMNGIAATGGTWTLTRCAMMRTTDGFHTNSAAILKAYGCLFGPHVFFDNDTDHATDSLVPFWTHPDPGIQRLGGSTSQPDEIIGCNIRAFFDTTGVTYDGTQYVNGTGTLGNPAAAMNGNKKNTSGTYLGNGSTTRYVKANYSNAATYSDGGPYQGVQFSYNWVDGSHYVCGLLFNAPPSGVHSFTFVGNRFGMGGAIWNGNWTYGRWPAGSIGVACGNVLDNVSNVPAARRGEALIVDSVGARVAP